jgi:hypothetical protein
VSAAERSQRAPDGPAAVGAVAAWRSAPVWVSGRAGAAVGQADVGQMQMHVGSEDVGPEDAGDGGAAGAGLLRLASPRPQLGAGTIRTPMRTMIIVGCGTDTSGRTSATSPLPGIDAELLRAGGLAIGRREALPDEGSG